MNQRRKTSPRNTPKTAASPPASTSPLPPSPRSASGQPSAQSKREANLLAAAKRRRARNLRETAGLAAVALVIIGGGYAYYHYQANLPGESVSQMRSPHIADSDPTPQYSTDPPTSGPHMQGVTAWGVRSEPVGKTAMVHNLEDGGVVISIQPDLDKTTVDQLTKIAESYPTEILMAPYPELSHPIVLTAWGRIDRLDALDEARIRRFVDTYRGQDHHRESGS